MQNPSDENFGFDQAKSGLPSHAQLSSELDRAMSNSDRKFHRALHKADQENWSKWRLAVARIILNRHFDKMVAVLVLLQLVLVVMQTDIEASDGELPPWITVASVLFLVVYSAELLLRLFVWQSSFLHSRLNAIDAALVVLDACAMLLSSTWGNLPMISVLRLVRVVRILRASRVVSQYRELYMILHGLWSAMKAVAWAVLMLMIVLTLWSIVAVQFVHPLVIDLIDRQILSCDRCGQAFQTVMSSNLTFFQTVVAGDSWGAIAVPVIENYPWTAIIFSSVFFSVSLGVMNLVLAVIVDSAMDARDKDMDHRLHSKALAFRGSVAQLSRLCAEMDTDKNGYLTKEEICNGFETNIDFRDVLNAMDADREDIDVLFEVLDVDNSGAISHDEFVTQLHKMKSQDVQTILVFIRCHLSHIRHDVETQLHLMKDELLGIVRSDHLLLASLDRSDQSVSSPIEVSTNRAASQKRDNASDAMSFQKRLDSTSPANAERIQDIFCEFQRNLDIRLQMILEDTVKQIGDQVAELRCNCQTICSLNQSLSKILSTSSCSVSESPQHDSTVFIKAEAEVGLPQQTSSEQVHKQIGPRGTAHQRPGEQLHPRMCLSAEQNSVVNRDHLVVI